MEANIGIHMNVENIHTTIHSLTGAALADMRALK